MGNSKKWILPVLLLSPTMAGARDLAVVENLPHGVIVHPIDANAAQVKLEAVAPGILRVTAHPDGNFSRTPSLMRTDAGTPPAVEITRTDRHITMTTQGISANIDTMTGRTSFFDAAGNPLLTERARTFTPVRFEGQDYYSIRQRFESLDDEALYGTGLHQQGWMNLKGKDVELLQHNIDKAIPYLVSTRGYGILWDNNSITRYGDPRGLRPLHASLELFDADGTPGALTARYQVNGLETVQRRENEVNYQYIKDLANFPQAGKNATQDGRSEVIWEGEIASHHAGRHTFSLYNSEYAKLHIDGARVIDRWRQNWNPWHHEFSLQMEAGRRYQLRLEWDRIDPSYIALLHRAPLPEDEADDLSIWSEAAQVIDYYVVAGEHSDQVIAGYRTLTGKAVLLPKWAYGFWQSRERYKTQAELTDVVDEYRRQKLPIDAIVLDWSYWPENGWGSHEFDPVHFPNPDAMVQHVHDQHAQIMISVWPKFYPNTGHYQELDKLGYIYQRNIELGERDWIGDGYLNSFYDPYAQQAQDIYWRQINDTLNRLGFDAWWLDNNEPDVHSNIDLDERKARTTPTALGPSVEFFNSYPLAHTEGVYRGSRSVDPDKRVAILSRAYFAGQQRTAAAFWSGDIVPRWDDLHEQISGLVNASMAGAPNVGFDIGGFSPEKRYQAKVPEHLPEWRELNLRWFQYGAFTPLFRLHGQFPYREIWEIAPQGTPHHASFVHYLKLRYTLLPYIYTLAGDSYHHDGTLLRALAMDFAADPITHDIADQYLFGPAFLVNPVTQFNARSRSVYLPNGTSWIDFNTGQRHHGGQTIMADAPLQRMPVFVRAGSIVPRTIVQQYVDEIPDAPLLIEVYIGENGAFSLYEDNGRDYGYERGEFSRIPLTWNEQKGELHIGARQGRYPGMPEQREMRVRWIDGVRTDAGELEPAADVVVQYAGQSLVVVKR